MSGTEEMCACGKPLHYTDEVAKQITEALIERLGPMAKVGTPWGVWEVPRHFLSIHGVKASELPELAAAYGFEKTADPDGPDLVFLEPEDEEEPTAEEPEPVEGPRSSMRSQLPNFPLVPCAYCGKDVVSMGYPLHLLAHGLVLLTERLAENGDESPVATLRQSLSDVETKVSQAVEDQSVTSSLRNVLHRTVRSDYGSFLEVLDLARALQGR